MLSTAAAGSSDVSEPLFGERERLLHPGVLLYSGTCSGLVAAVGGLLAFATGLALYSPPGAPKAPPGSWWHLIGLLLFLLPLAAVAAVVVTCALLIPIHHLLVRLRFRSHVFYQVAMLAIVLASYYVLMAGEEWSLAFTIPFAAVPGALVFRHFAYTVHPIPHGRPEALTVLLWAVAYLNWLIIIMPPSQVRAAGEVCGFWIWYGMPAMTLLAMMALIARAWSRRVMASLACVGLALPLGFAAALLVASLPLRLAANDRSVGVHWRLDTGAGQLNVRKRLREAAWHAQDFECRQASRGIG